MVFSSHLRKYRLAAGLSQKELAGRLFVSQQAVARWETDKATPNPETVVKIAAIFGVTTDELLGKEDSPVQGVVKVPVLGSIPAGIPVEAVEDILDWEEIPASWAVGGREYFGLKVKGDSMYPKYLEGDTVILRKQDSCDSGDDCVVMVNGYDATLKQVFLREDGSIEIRPLNPSYPPTTYTPDDIAKLPVSIAGVVVELRRKIK